jgi:hypothetical protein
MPAGPSENLVQGEATMQRLAELFAGLAMIAMSGWAGAQSTVPRLEYLMTYEAELEPQVINDKLVIYAVKPGGWVKGPGIRGSFIAPGADWLRIMASGVARLDVRATIKTDEGDLIYITYNGVIQHSAKSYDNLVKGEKVTPADGIYFVTAPTFETTSKKYGWLNGVQAINTFVEARVNPAGSYVRYDVFVVR